MLKLGVIGYGFVGKAVANGFNTEKVQQFLIDPKFNTTVEDLKHCNPDVTFICVPTPMGLDGSIDTSILEEVVPHVIEHISGLIVIKSTVTPDFLDKYSESIIYNPEFLTEKNSLDDFKNPKFHIFGGKLEDTTKLSRIYYEYSNCNPSPEYHMTAKEASLVKYGINSFLASKVLWFNEFHSLVETVSPGSFNLVRSVIGADPRISPSHTNVPGPDRKKGFGGPCFTKDCMALIKFAQSQNQPLSTLEHIYSKNRIIRTHAGLNDREAEQHVDYNITV